MTIEEIKELDQELLILYQSLKEETALDDPKSKLREKWNIIKTNEKILSASLKLIDTTDINKINFVSPAIASLVLMDYESVDPIAYDVVSRLVINNNFLKNRINPFLEEYNFTYLITLLFNKNLELDDERETIINNIKRQTHDFNPVYACYYLLMHPSFNKNILFRNDLYGPDLGALLTDYEERAKLRKLTKLPF